MARLGGSAKDAPRGGGAVLAKKRVVRRVGSRPNGRKAMAGALPALRCATRHATIDNTRVMLRKGAGYEAPVIVYLADQRPLSDEERETQRKIRIRRSDDPKMRRHHDVVFPTIPVLKLNRGIVVARRHTHTSSNVWFRPTTCVRLPEVRSFLLAGQQL
jgi:hypothetical protein